MEKRRIEIEPPVAVSGRTVLLITATSVHGRRDKAGLSFSGFKQPLYILIKGPGLPAKFYNPEGIEVNPDRIISEHPALREKLAKYRI